jgi:hypothetical protein
MFGTSSQTGNPVKEKHDEHEHNEPEEEKTPSMVRYSRSIPVAASNF